MKMIAVPDNETMTDPIYLSPTETSYSIVLGKNASCCIMSMSPAPSHQITIEQQEASNMQYLSFCLGSENVKAEINIKLLGEHATCAIDGLDYVKHDKQYHEQYINIEHLASHTQSHVLCKGIADNAARSLFHARVIVAPNVRKIIVNQASHHIVLSDKAEVFTQPQLEIEANDINCKHAATIGQLDQEALFYLRARGVPMDEAKNILLHGFAEEVIQKIKWLDVAARVREWLN